ncbi:MAG TPA: UvrD-helicase domain-containing protein [Polyangiaceae bacterium]|nr:UvrD-helicase domain-containing protein [Polyangiaceae bacterium]
MAVPVRTSQLPLNPSQREAVEHDLGPLLVLAGAGSGKTRVVTARIARLLERGVLARSILAMTFTNKAAEEMKERVRKMVGAGAAKDLVVSTFHSFGLRVLSAEARSLDLRNGEFTIFDQGDCAGAVREILRGVRGGKKYDVAAILARISHAQNQLVDDDQLFAGEEKSDYDEIAKIIWPKYRAALRGFHAFDFDDLVCEPVRLFRRRAEVLERWQERFRYVLVDEYQDTNHAQLELVRLLASGHRNLCVVGDDDQSIYAWRGADVSNILDFESHFPGAKVVKLQENYRSTSTVLAVANSVLERTSARRHAKVLKATRDGGATVNLVVAQDQDVEAAFIADEVKRLHTEGRKLREMAILYRSNLQSDVIESALKERGLGVTMLGGTQFYERKEVKDLLAYLRVVLNPRDEIGLRRILNYPARQIGEAALGKIENAANVNKESLFDAVLRAPMIADMAPPSVAGCRALASVIQTAQQALAGGAPSAEVARNIVRSLAMREDIFDGSGSNEHAARRWGNVESLFRVLDRHDARTQGGGREKLRELIQFLTLDPNRGEETAERAVTMTTMHGAKGLEFEVVFIAGLEEGLMPHSRALEGRVTDIGGKLANDVEEERRLFYVSITRAKDKLYLCRAKQRASRGKIMVRTPSRFLSDIADDLLERRDVTAKTPPNFSETAQRGAALLAALSGGPTTRR